ncbi:MAG: restriction endonuclease [Bacteroidales bacterium]|nr:restriction endonuclease [Bacteroidales bacterium]
MIVNHPNYKGLPYKKGEDGKVRWVVTGKSEEGEERRKWWTEQCKKLGIKIEAGCWAKVAVAIHPTKMHVCQICGKSLSIEYVYPNKRSINALKNCLGVSIEPFSMSIYEIVEKYGSNPNGLNAIKSAFKIESCNATQQDLAKFIVDNCETMLSPGVMSNSPDRFDGFHSDGNCCRGESDKGRHKDNLQRYGQDRRVYENWADGNWKMADRLMSEFAKHGVSADHIGPISLGFCHRPKFQPMTKSENSAKNNRMSLNDVQTLIKDEDNGEQVISWHSKYIWDLLKHKVKTDEDAVKLSSIMRNNLHHILLALSIISENGGNDFLETLLNPEYSFYDYKFVGFNPQTGEYKSVETKNLTGKNQQNNVERYKRIAFESLEEYKSKNNRRQYAWNDAKVDKLFKKVLESVKQGDDSKTLQYLQETFAQLAETAAAKW